MSYFSASFFLSFDDWAIQRQWCRTVVFLQLHGCLLAMKRRVPYNIYLISRFFLLHCQYTHTATSYQKYYRSHSLDQCIFKQLSLRNCLAIATSHSSIRLLGYLLLRLVAAVSSCLLQFLWMGACGVGISDFVKGFYQSFC